MDKPDLQDIAEIGASANALFSLYHSMGIESAKDALVAAAEFLLTQVAVENSGAIYKSAQARHVDILNGDIYAALTLSRAFEVTGDARFLQQAGLIVDHVEARFGAWRTGWWPYAEKWDGTMAVGASVAYQATIIAFGMPISRVLAADRATEWEAVLATALNTVAEQLPIGPTDETEAPSWSRDWANVWEIPLAFSKFPELGDTKNYLQGRLHDVDRGIQASGIEALRPKALQNAGRTPVTSLYRKAATFAGFLSDVYMTSNVELPKFSSPASRSGS
ncbi:hypothetical protein [Paenarthrobacter sp. FR1]|uniref:hypothetical protein n=1 Tax=Paenarthrobacter sp. FR1 TaxID=3439548 RepID=UPI003DA4BEBF